MNWLNEVALDMQQAVTPPPIPEGMTPLTQQQMEWALRWLASQWGLVVVEFAFGIFLAWIARDILLGLLDLLTTFVRRWYSRRFTPEVLHDLPE